MSSGWEAAARAARAIAHEAAILAANMQAGATARDKGGDLGPVTDADVAVEALILGRLREAFPTDAILAEESGAQGESERTWCVDPIDGTREYIKKLPEYAVHIGLVAGGDAVAGAVAIPATGAIYWGWSGGGAFRDDTPVTLAPCPPLSEATLIHTRSRKSNTLKQAIERLGVRATIEAGGVGYKVSRVLEGAAHLYVHPRDGTTWWDTVAPAAVIRAAGGVAADALGRALRFAGDIRHEHGLVFGGPGADERVRARNETNPRS